MAQEHVLKIIDINQAAPNVKRFRLEKPLDFKFIPGHSVMVSLPENKSNVHPFSFTSTNDDPYLEFHIKKFDNPGNFTQQLHAQKVGDTVLLADIFGSIRYVGPGLMIAGGQAITPFIAILRQLKKDNALAGNILIHSIQTHQNIFLENELRSMLKENYVITLTQEKHPAFLHGRITPELLKKYILLNKKTYILGPDAFVSQIKTLIKSL